MDKLTENEYFIALTDYLIINAPSYGVFNFYTILVNNDVDTNKYFLPIEISEKSENNKFDFIINYADKERGYIQRAQNNRSHEMFELTLLGREIKNRGGYKKWKLFNDSLESVPLENIRWMQETAQANRDAAKAANVSANYTKKTFYLIMIYTLLTLLIVINSIITCNYQRNQNNQTKTPNSNTDTTAKKVTDILK